MWMADTYIEVTRHTDAHKGVGMTSPNLMKTKRNHNYNILIFILRIIPTSEVIALRSKVRTSRSWVLTA
jgi:hypothetical protein